MEQLRAERRWCVWKKEARPSGMTKVPYISATDRGKSNDPACWIEYGDAAQIKETNPDVAGLGFFLSAREEQSEMTLCVIDVDAHHTEEGDNPLADELLHHFSGTYIERSPSGTGYHIICNMQKASIPRDQNDRFAYYLKNSDKELEIYIGGLTHRFMTFTGDRVSDGEMITDQTEQVLAFLNTYMRKPEQRRYTEPAATVPTADVDIQERLNIARRSKYGEKFRKLYDDGDWASQSSRSQSEADLYLARQLCYWLGPDAEKIDEAFRASHLFRPKWDEMRGQDTYGNITIRAAIDRCDRVYTPTTHHATGERAGWRDELSRNAVELTGETALADQSINNIPITPEDVLQMINDIQDDVAMHDRITVLPLMCGTGKSTALRLKMMQIIEANDGDGMIIVTDNKDRMRDYLLPSDEDQRSFFIDYDDKITVMTSETLQRDLQKQHQCPILIMSTQRYTMLLHSDIERYLTWDGGRRSQIVVDEQRYFRKEVSITEENINQICSAISMGISQREEPAATDRHVLLEFWNVSVKAYLTNVINAKKQTFTEPNQYYFWCRLNWHEDERFSQMLALMNKYKTEINTFRQDNTFVDIITRARAIHQLLAQGALLQMKVPNDTSKPVKAAFSVLLDNYSNYTNLDAKVIILDGTANLSNEYKLYPDLDKRNCDQYRRKLDLLHIKLIDAVVGKTQLERDYGLRENTVRKVREYLSEHLPEAAEPVIFSYKMLSAQWQRIYDDKRVSWFGKIRGSNDFRKEKYVAQIGLNRYPPASYFLYYLALHPELEAELNDKHDYTEHTEIINRHMSLSNAEMLKIQNDEILAELEQNIFRGTIRNSDSTEDYTFYLFTSLWRESLEQALHARYDVLQAHIEQAGSISEEERVHFMERQHGGGLTAAQKIVRWHDYELPCPATYTMAQMAEGTGLTASDINTAKRAQNNQQLHDWFAAERRRPSREPIYDKTHNWYYDVEETEDEEQPF